MSKSEFLANVSIDTQDDKIEALPCHDDSDGWLISPSSTTIVSTTYLSDHHHQKMDNSPSKQPLLPKKHSRLVLKACRSTSKDIQQQLSISDVPGMASDNDDVFSSDSDSSFEDLKTYNASCDRIFDTYFDRTTKQTPTSSRSPLYQVDPSGSPVPIHEIQPHHPRRQNLPSPLRRRDAKRTPPRLQPEYNLFPTPEPKPQYTHPQHHSLPARSDSLLPMNMNMTIEPTTNPTPRRTRTRARANTTPCNSNTSSRLALSTTSTSTPTSPVPPVSPRPEISSFDDDDEDDFRPAWRKALLHIRASSGSAAEKEKEKEVEVAAHQGRSSLKKKARSASQRLQEVFKKKGGGVAVSPV